MIMPYTLFLTVIVLTLTALSPYTAAAEERFIKPYKLSYTTTYKFILPLQGTAIRELQQTGDSQWQIRHRIDSTVIALEESSDFTYQAGGIQPIDYHYRQSALGKSREIDLIFDWNRQVATNRAASPVVDIKLPPDALDKLNYQLQLRIDLATDGQLRTYRVTGRKRLREYRFELLGETLLETAVGPLNTVKLRRARDPDDDRETQIWLAKDWDYVVVQIAQEERGKSYEIKFLEGELNGEPILGVKR